MGIFVVILCFLFVIFPIFWKYIYINKFQFNRLYLNWNIIDNKYNIKRIISILIAIAILIFYFSIRYIPTLITVIEHNLINKIPSEFRSANLSAVFLLDICSLTAILMPLLSIFDKKKRIMKIIAPFALLGGIMAISFTCFDVFKEWNVKEFFLGGDSFGVIEGKEPLMITMHLWLTVYGINTMVWSDKYNWKDIGYLFLFIIFYISYVVSISQTLDIKNHVFALNWGDFYLVEDKDYYRYNGNGLEIINNPKPTYSTFTNIFPLKHKWEVFIFCWCCFIWFLFSSIIIRNIFGMFKKQPIIMH